MKLTELQSLLKTAAVELNIPYRQAVFCFLIEDFLRRVGGSKVANKIELRGGLLTYAYTGMLSRPFDVIELGFSAETSLLQTVREVLRVSGQVETADVIELSPYEVQYVARLGEITLPIRIIGTVVQSLSEERFEIPVLLDGFSAPVVILPQIETEVCRRLTELVWQLPLTGQMDALFDLYFWSLQFDFTGEELQPVLRQTLKESGISVETLQTVFALQNDAALERRWRAFVKDAGFKPTFGETLDRVQRFLAPAWDSVFHEIRLTSHWDARTTRWEDDAYLY